MASANAFRDGSLAFDGGINSIATPTIASAGNPNGLQRNQLAWALNASLRDGGISPRPGWLYRATISNNTGLFQGKAIYTPFGANPYEIWAISGNILKVDLETYEITNLSAAFGLQMPADQTYFFFVQAEQFMVIQAGDGVTLPLFWDGALLRRSNGLTGTVGGAPAASYQLSFVDNWYVPTVGNTVNVVLTGNYTGSNGDTGLLEGIVGLDQGVFLGNFEVVAGAGTPNLTLKTISSDYVGALVNNSPAVHRFVVNPSSSPSGTNELPAATAMCYYMGRIWYAQDRTVSAGDIVGGTSGTIAYEFRDSVLKVTENPMAVGGDGFTVPSQDGSVIRGIAYSASIDAALGQGRLFVGTRKAIYSLQVPVTRADWISATSANQPLMTVVQLTNGWVNDRSIVSVNGDLFYQSLEPGIRSLQQSVRNFTQWGQVDLSANEQRILQFVNRSLLRFASGIFFQNRLLQTTLPRQTNQGVVHDQIIPMDVVPISSFNAQRQPNWEGSYQSMPTFQMCVADFGGRERAFAAVRSETSGEIQIWEITRESRVDFKTDPETDGNRITLQAETPAFNWSDSVGALELKKLVGGELWVDRLFGTVVFNVEYRPDGATCWLPWRQWEECSPQNTDETVAAPIGYPINLGPCYKATMALPIPDPSCAPCNTGRPSNIAFQFQIRLTIKGYCRVRGIWMWAEKDERGLYSQLVC